MWKIIIGLILFFVAVTRVTVICFRGDTWSVGCSHHLFIGLHRSVCLCYPVMLQVCWCIAHFAVATDITVDVYTRNLVNTVALYSHK